MPTPSRHAAPPSPPPASAAEIDGALARAVLTRLLQRGLERPAAEIGGTLVSESARVAIVEAVRVLEGGAGPAPGPLRLAVSNLVSIDVPDLAELEAAHDRLFGHSLRGRVCAYELEYGRRDLLQQAQELADLAGFYHAFGLRVASGERADHVACELAFLEFLCRKEAYALDAGDEEMVEATRTAQRRFLSEHLGRFGRAFARALRTAAELELHRRLAVLIEVFLELACRQLEVPLGPAMLELRAPEDPAPMACGGEDCNTLDSSDSGLVPLGGVLPSRSGERSS